MRKKRAKRGRKKGKGLAEYVRNRKPDVHSRSYGAFKKRQEWEYMMSKKARGMRFRGAGMRLTGAGMRLTGAGMSLTGSGMSMRGAGLMKARHPRRHK